MAKSARHEFLSPGWIAAIENLRDEFADRAPAPTMVLRANVVIGDAPFDEPEIQGHIDTSLGLKTLQLGPGYRVNPDGDFFAELKALLGEAAVVSGS